MTPSAISSSKIGQIQILIHKHLDIYQISETSADNQNSLSDHGKQENSFSLAQSMEFWVGNKDFCYWKADAKTMDSFMVNSFPAGKYFPPSPKKILRFLFLT